MTNQVPIVAVLLIILSGWFCGLSVRNSNSLQAKLIRKYGWIIILACFAYIISIQIQHPFGAVDIIEDLPMFFMGYLIFQTSKKTKIK